MKKNNQKINPEIFHAYDIRGIYPGDLNEEAAYKIGLAFVKFLRKKNKKEKMNIVVGRDNRVSSPSLYKSLTKGITDAGANVINIGLSTSPMFYWTVGYYKFDGGINITASHNPREYNGFKLVREKASKISEKSGIKEIKNLSQKIKASEFSKIKKGIIKKKNILSEYIKDNLALTDVKKIKKLKIVIDTANSVSGIVIPKIFQKTQCKIYHLFSKLDGNFPNHLPDPVKKENLRSLFLKIKKRKADLGIAFDGDGDRMIFVSKKGEMIPGYLITTFIADIILGNNPKQKILFDIRASNIVPEIIINKGGKPIIYRIGHALISNKMAKEKIFFAGELTGHYFLKKHYYCESPFFVLFKILEKMSESGKNISELVKPYQKYFHSGEINFKVKDKEKILKLLEKKYKKGKILKLDGLRINFNDWWFLVRASNTEPVLRLVVEAKTKNKMEEKVKELKKIITNF
jgi:phosphomannomutase